jgi:hypothetical protein
MLSCLSNVRFIENPIYHQSLQGYQGYAQTHSVKVHIIRASHYVAASYPAFTLNTQQRPCGPSRAYFGHLVHLRIIPPHTSLDFMFPVRAEPHDTILARSNNK